MGFGVSFGCRVADSFQEGHRVRALSGCPSRKSIRIHTRVV